MASSIYPTPWKILLTLLGTCVLSALVWFVGPRLQFGDTAPLASFISRYLIAGGLFTLWATVTLYTLMSGRRPSPDPTANATSAGRPDSPQKNDRRTDTVLMANFGYYGKFPMPAKPGYKPADNASSEPGEQTIHYNLPIAFVTSWHDWLSVLMDQGAAGYSDKWAALYQQSPAYRFALSPGIAGDAGWAGVMLPVMAADGNHFPLCFAAALPDGVSAAEAPNQLDTWYTLLERLAEKVSGKGYKPDQLRKDAERFATSTACTANIPSPRAATFETGTSGSEGSVSVRVNAAQALDSNTDQLPLVAALLTQTFYQYSVWTTSLNGTKGGSDSVIASGLPTDTQGLALFSRDWAGSGCGNLLLSGSPDSQRQLRKPRLTSAINPGSPETSKHTQAPIENDQGQDEPMRDDNDITLLKCPDSTISEGHDAGFGRAKRKGD